MKHLYKVLYLAPLPFLQSFDICRFSYFFAKSHPFLLPFSELFAQILLQISQLGFQIILFKNISEIKFRSPCAWNSLIWRAAEGGGIQSVSLTHIFSFGLFEALHFISTLYEDTAVDACFLASVAVSVSAFTHPNKVVVCHFQILHVKSKSFLWSPFPELNNLQFS